jgi:hypothetical protein
MVEAYQSDQLEDLRNAKGRCKGFPWRIDKLAKMCDSLLADSRSYFKQNVKPEHI